MHAQVIGTTSAGKTESVVLPWAIQDIQSGSGLVIVDGKSDSAFLDKIYAYSVAAGRGHDFRLVSLAHLGPSTTFNPLVGGSTEEAVERVFSSFKIENEYYRAVQYRIFLRLVRVIKANGTVPTFALIHRLLMDEETLRTWARICPDLDLARETLAFCDRPQREKNEATSGLEALLGPFAEGPYSVLFNDTDT